MATINYTAPDGTQHQIPLPEGADPNQVVAEYETAPNFSAPGLQDALPSLDFPDDLPSSIAEATEGRGPTFGESVKRGLGLGARLIPSFAAKIPSMAADFGASVLNVPIAGLDKLGQLVGDEPLDARLPTDATQNVDELLNNIFPEPESFGERVLAGISDLAAIGVTGGAIESLLKSLASSFNSLCRFLRSLDSCSIPTKSKDKIIKNRENRQNSFFIKLTFKFFKLPFYAIVSPILNQRIA